MGIGILEITKFSFISIFCLRLDLPNHLSSLGQINMPAKIIDAVFQWKNLCFLVEIQL